MIIGAQLYTRRDFCRNLDDFSENLKKVADIGYTSVQVSGTCPLRGGMAPGRAEKERPHLRHHPFRLQPGPE